jgi:hypothetical protein
MAWRANNLHCSFIILGFWSLWRRSWSGCSFCVPLLSSSRI